MEGERRGVSVWDNVSTCKCCKGAMGHNTVIFVMTKKAWHLWWELISSLVYGNHTKSFLGKNDLFPTWTKWYLCLNQNISIALSWDKTSNLTWRNVKLQTFYFGDLASMAMSIHNINYLNDKIRIYRSSVTLLAHSLELIWNPTLILLSFFLHTVNNPNP